MFAHTLCERKGLNTHGACGRKSLNTHCLSVSSLLYCFRAAAVTASYCQQIYEGNVYSSASIHIAFLPRAQNNLGIQALPSTYTMCIQALPSTLYVYLSSTIF